MHSEIRKYCKHIVKAQQQVLRYDKKEGSWYWDLPAMASICHDGNYVKKKRGFSHHPAGTKWSGVLKGALQQLGNIGEHSLLGKKYIIGNCAEQHAANNYMVSYRENNLAKLHFSEAVRPRTMQEFDPCDNCKAIFPGI